MSGTFAWPLSFGATLLGEGRTRFRFWAPGQKEVALTLEGAAPMPMTREQNGWFTAEAACGAGTRYRYKLDDGLLVPDPASRAQSDDVHGPSIVIDPAAYRWRHPDWKGRPWPETIIYELHAGTFGGFSGVKRELARLASLGVTAIELMPIADFPGRRNWGYDGVLPFAPDTAYGTPEELKDLVDAAHEQRLMIFLDVVYNHFGPDGNYLHCYAPEMFRSDLRTPWGAAIDFRQPEVRRFFIENALYWLMEYRFDGLRFDAVHAISDPDWLDEVAATIRATAERGRHVHLVLEHDGNEATHLDGGFDAQWNDDGHHALHVLLTGERDGYYGDYADDPAGHLARVLAEGFCYQGEPSAYRAAIPRGTPSAHLPPTAFVLFLQNHDQVGNRPMGDRLTALVEPATLEAAIALQMLCPQIPLLFMGEEFASRSPFFYFTDHHGELAAQVREGRRREFLHFKGFSDWQCRAAIPDPNAPKTFEASIPQPDPRIGAAREALYRRLIDIRCNAIVPRLPGAHALDAKKIGPAAVVARWRMGDGAMLTLATNLAAAPASAQLPEGRVLFATTDAAVEQLRAGQLLANTTVALLAGAP